MSELGPLEAIRRVADEYGLRTSDLKPCIAVLLDGNLGGTDRHTAAFVIAIELRRMGLDEIQAQKILIRWARKIGYSPRQAERCARDAFKRKPDGKYRYHPPGLCKKPGTRYYEVLAAICATVGCPQNCPPFSHLYRGPRSETFAKFCQLGWAEGLRRRRWGAAFELYRALCELEKRRGIAPGAQLITAYRPIATIARVNPRTVGRELRRLHALGLIVFEPGSGSGPKAGDRSASRIARVVPIPGPSEAVYLRAITTGGIPPPDIGGL